MIARQGTD